MKNLFYIPFLFLMSVTYSRIVETAKDGSFESSRAPASVEALEEVGCANSAAHFNKPKVYQKCE